MSSFLSRLVSNHINSPGNIMPRLKGQFETFSAFQQPVPGILNEGSSENNISNQYNLIQHSTNKFTNSGINTNEIQNENISANEEINTGYATSINNKNQQTFKPANVYLNTSDVNKTHENETNYSNIFKPQSDSFNISKPENTSLINNGFKNTTNVENNDLSEETSEKYLLIPDTTIAMSDFITKQNNLEEQKNGAEHSIPKQPLDNDKQQQSMTVVNAFRLMQNKDVTSGNNLHESTQVIKVNIGRIDVRAVTQQKPLRETVRPKPLMSLDDFLKKEKGSKL